MILDPAAYARLRFDEERRALAALSPDESLVLGADLWTSSVAAHVRFAPEARPESLARRLRVAPARLAAAWAAAER
jgi:hypothetical protein